MFGLVDAFLHLPFCCVDPGLIAFCALCGTGTVNSEIFARVLFSRNAKFRENKFLTNWRNHSVVY